MIPFRLSFLHMKCSWTPIRIGPITMLSILNKLTLALAICLLTSATASSQGLLQRFVPVDRVPADSSGDYRLTEKQGPWLIMAATFSGENGEQQGNHLVMEFRRRFNLPAYLHDVTFNYDEKNLGRGIDGRGARIRRQYQQSGEKHEWAVLVGSFETVDDPRGQQLLKRVKTLHPNALEAEGGESSQNLSEFRRLQNAMMAKLGKGAALGSMSKAFMAPNPLLPREYFVSKGVDDFIVKMNKGVKYNLLDCKGKYTVRIATFRGRSILQTSGTSDDKKPRRGGSLVEAAENAHLLAEELRKHDWEAYEFHDRAQSIVTIGSFDRPGRRMADGRVIPAGKAEQIIQTFGAKYDTPSDPLNGDDAVNRQRREAALHQLSASIAAQSGPLASGMNPKHVKILRRRKVRRLIPMDVYPTIIEAPKKSISSSYFRS